MRYDLTILDINQGKKVDNVSINFFFITTEKNRDRYIVYTGFKLLFFK